MAEREVPAAGQSAGFGSDEEAQKEKIPDERLIRGIISGMRKPHTDLTGQIFGHIRVDQMVHSGTRRGYRVVCTCLACGKTGLNMNPTDLKAGRIKACGCTRLYRKGADNPQFTGCGGIHRSRWQRMEHGARKRGLEFAIGIEEAWALFVAQEEKCALTGVPIEFGEGFNDSFTASLDRIDSSKGYIFGNVQWVHKIVNKMKRDLPEEEFVQFCKLVADYAKPRAAAHA